MTVLVYSVHSANLFGTERMALETLKGLSDRYHPIMLCPPGDLVQETAKYDIETLTYCSKSELARIIFKILKSETSVILMATTLTESLAFAFVNLFLRRQTSHLHMVHGGAEDQLSYGKKWYLNRFKLLFVAVSPFVREKLVEFGVRKERIRVVENFMTVETRASYLKSEPFQRKKALRGIAISRIASEKKIEVLFDALESQPGLEDFSFTIYGEGGLRESLQERARRHDLQVVLPGFSKTLNQSIRDYDFLIHLCPHEPFGLVILEAMAAGIPVIVPNQGGVATMVRDGETGLMFPANDPAGLAETLRAFAKMPEDQVRVMVHNAEQTLDTTFSQESRLTAYCETIEEAGNL